MGLSPPRQFAVRRVSKDAATPPTSTNRCRPEALRTAADDPEAAVGRIIELAKTRIPSGSVSPVRDIQVLSPMNRGGVCARSSMPVRKTFIGQLLDTDRRSYNKSLISLALPSRLLKMQLKWALASGWRCLRV